MSREILDRAADEVEDAREALEDPTDRERLETLGGRLRSQAERETTPALGTLDRVQNGLAEVAAETDDAEVSERLEAAREHVFSFLETLEDRGMKQHGSERDGSP